MEILSAEISDPAIKTMLNAAQHDTVKNNIELAQTRRTVDATKAREALTRERMLAEADTAKAKHDLMQIAIRQKAEITLLELANELAKIAETKKTEIAAQEVKDLVSASGLSRERAAMQQAQEFKSKDVELEKVRMAAEVDAAVKRFEAAGKQFGDVALALNNNETLRVMAESLNTLRFIGGNTVVDAVQKKHMGPMPEINFAKYMEQDMVRFISAIDQSLKIVEEDQPKNTLEWGDRGWHPLTLRKGYSRKVYGLSIVIYTDNEAVVEVRSRNEKFDKWIIQFSNPVSDPEFFAKFNQFLKKFFLDE